MFFIFGLKPMLPLESKNAYADKMMLWCASNLSSISFGL